MGSCGCGDFSPLWKLPGPDGITYAIEIYGPCDFCYTPLGVRIYQITDDQLTTWGVDELPDLEMYGYACTDRGDLNAEALIALLDPEQLKLDLLDEYESYHVVKSAMIATRDIERKELERIRRRESAKKIEVE